MKELLPEIDQWLAKGEKVALATVVRTWGSSPRGIGAKMAITPSGKISGSVSGGCVEGAVFEAGVEVLKSNTPQLLHFGVADETAWTVGLACGGQIDIYVKPLEESSLTRLRSELQAGQSFCVASVIRGPVNFLGKEMLIGRDDQVVGPFIPDLPGAVLEKASQARHAGASQVISIQDVNQEPVDIFLDVIQPQPLLVIVGGVHIAIALSSLANTLGFRTVVIDPRRAFGSPEQFPHVDRLIQAWPDDAFPQIQLNDGTAIAILTDDPKIDDPAVILALDSPAFYIGVLGSQTTQAKRRKRLLQTGIKEEQLARIHGPIGLQLGGTTPEEIALAIMGEIVTVRHS